MRKVLGMICMILGTVLIASALSLFIFNKKEARSAKQMAQDALVTLVGEMEEQQEMAVSGELILSEGETHSAKLNMDVIEIDGNRYVGFVSLPTLGLELPILAEWDYDLLQLAPCLYSGTTYTNDMVLMAHNYESHFGRIDELEIGDEVLFTDVSGGVLRYEVVARDVLAPTAVEEMTAGAYDLTLFTCTYGGAQRVTIRCDYTKG